MVLETSWLEKWIYTSLRYTWKFTGVFFTFIFLTVFCHVESCCLNLLLFLIVEDTGNRELTSIKLRNEILEAYKSTQWFTHLKGGKPFFLKNRNQERCHRRPQFLNTYPTGEQLGSSTTFPWVILSISISSSSLKGASFIRVWPSCFSFLPSLSF